MPEHQCPGYEKRTDLQALSEFAVCKHWKGDGFCDLGRCCQWPEQWRKAGLDWVQGEIQIKQGEV